MIQIRVQQGFRDAAFMGIMRWVFYSRIKGMYPEMVSMTFGYITNNTRIRHGLEKTHVVDTRFRSTLNIHLEQ